jgi:polyhydroxyalkanoate synthesis repressor PhaR
MADDTQPLLIKRYASRRLYNTETSDYVTLEDIAGFIRAGREVQIVDLKSGDDLTRQYLLQIIAEHESRGESVLPLGVLTDLVRSYTTQAQSVVPQFLAMSFDMLREGQSKMMENMGKMAPMAGVPGFEAMKAQQAAFMKAMTGGMAGWPSGPRAEEDEDTAPRPRTSSPRSASSSPTSRSSSRRSVTPDGRILAGSGAIVAGDYIGRTFPIRYAVTRDAAPQASAGTGVGTVEVVDADTLIVTLEGQAPLTLSRTGADAFGDGAVTFTRDDAGAAQYLFLSGGASERGLAAAFGFETPVAARPAVASYMATSAATLYIAPEGSGTGIRVGGSGSVNLLALFSGSGGTITGTLIDGRETVDFDADGVVNDTFSVTTTLDGAITEGGFTGTLGGSASVSIAGGPARDLGLVLGNSVATGSFFGPAAEVASGTYGADVTFTPPGEPVRAGRLSGFFLATTQ